MFGSFKSYVQQDYADAHDMIYIVSIYEGYNVEVFAAYGKKRLIFNMLKQSFKRMCHFYNL